MKNNLITAKDIPFKNFDKLIDVRSPAEFADDHIPGAINCPVLSNDERAEIGTLYKQVSPFAARKRGAILTARNIASAIETHFLDQPKDWRPLVYCWRGGQRSGAFQIVLEQIGFRAARVDGGYKAWRTYVLQQLDLLPTRVQFYVLDGPTGAGKTLLLRALRDHGAQVLDLEGLAGHKGSVLGAPIGHTQTPRKSFDAQLFETLSRFDPAVPVWVEGESKRIGDIHLPNALMTAILNGKRFLIDPPRAARVNYLLRDYASLIHNPDDVRARLSGLRHVVSRAQIEDWHGMIARGEWASLVDTLLEHHYDPLYARTQKRTQITAPQHVITPDCIDESHYHRVAAALVNS
jgi:tRNA 2-selenouridine synthase